MGTIKGSESCEFWLKLTRAYYKAVAIGKKDVVNLIDVYEIYLGILIQQMFQVREKFSKLFGLGTR